MPAFYDNCKMLDQNNNFMCFVDQDKMDWYLKKNLAEKLDDKTFKINFIPNGDGVKQPYYKNAIKNECVCCGSTENLTKHHVLPYRFKRYFPETFKSHISFDLLLLCEECHVKYEIEANKFQKELFIKSNVFFNKEYKSVLNTVSSLITHFDTIPDDRKEKMFKKIREYFKDDSIGMEQLPEYLKSVSSKEEIKKSIQNIVLQMGGFFEFTVMWRKHFIETMSPKHLPKEWIDGIEDKKTINATC